MSAWSLQELADAIGGRWVGTSPADPSGVLVFGAAIDSREVAPAAVFFAFRGASVDGHAFVGAAFERGAACAVISDESAVADDASRGGPLLIVPDVRAAMAGAASAWRERLGSAGEATVVAVTGSNGKTSTVRLLASVLERVGTVAASRKSHNNTLGLALTLLNAPLGSRFVVCEVGTSGPGEIAALAAIARPDVSVVTSVGRAHLEELGSTLGVANEKADLLRALSRGGLGVFNGTTRHADVLADAVPSGAERIAVGAIGVRETTLLNDRTRFVLDDGAGFDVPMVGVHHAANAALVVAIARWLGLSDDEIRSGLRDAEPPPMRASVRVAGDVLVMNDAYNANPDSMIGAIDTFASVAGDRPRVLVLGEMLELGDHREAEHRAIGLHAAGTKPRLLVFVGPTAEVAAEAARSAGGRAAVQSRLDAPAIAGLIEPGDAVLLKGSRAIGLERVDALIGGTPPDARQQGVQRSASSA